MFLRLDLITTAVMLVILSFGVRFLSIQHEDTLLSEARMVASSGNNLGSTFLWRANVTSGRIECEVHNRTNTRSRSHHC